MGLHISRNDVPGHSETLNSGGLGAKSGMGVHGNECSLSSVTRQPDYHTMPHRHDGEQVNYVLDGEIWFYVGNKACRCRPGDFQRIPRNAIHWAWNRSDKPATVIQTKSPPAAEDAHNWRAPGLFDDDEAPSLRIRANEHEDIYEHDAEIAEESEPLTNGLYVPAEKLPLVRSQHPTTSGEPEVRGVYGTELGYALVGWPAGYHSSPYLHDAEALIHILDGEIWIFVEDRGFRCQAGDFQRIPRNAIHWEWNVSDKPARAIVEYSPPLLEMDTISLKAGATPEGWVALFDDEEEPRLYGNARIYGVTYDGSKTEARYGLK